MFKDFVYFLNMVSKQFFFFWLPASFANVVSKSSVLHTFIITASKWCCCSCCCFWCEWQTAKRNSWSAQMQKILPFPSPHPTHTYKCRKYLKVLSWWGESGKNTEENFFQLQVAARTPSMWMRWKFKTGAHTYIYIYLCKYKWRLMSKVKKWALVIKEDFLLSHSN